MNDDNNLDYKSILLDEEPMKKGYLPVLIIVIIIVIGLVFAGVFINKKITNKKYADLKIAEIINVSKIGISDDSDVGVSFSKKKIHVDVKEIENPNGMFTFDVVFENVGKDHGKATNFKIENKSNEDVVVREIEQNISSSSIADGGKETLKLTVVPNPSNNKTEKIGEKYNCSFDIVYDTETNE